MGELIKTGVIWKIKKTGGYLIDDGYGTSISNKMKFATVFDDGNLERMLEAIPIRYKNYGILSLEDLEKIPVELRVKG